MEKISKNNRHIGPFKDSRFREFKKWEVVYFLSPYCDGTCAHCWSSDSFLGRYMPLKWHQKFWDHVSGGKVNEVRITGGEPFLYKDIGSVLSGVRKSLGRESLIKIFTSGRPFIALNKPPFGPGKTADNLRKLGIPLDNLEIHMSADEFHAGSLFRSIYGIKRAPFSVKENRAMNEKGVPYLKIQVANFLEACAELEKETQGRFKGAKLKIHVDQGRLDYHREKIFGWMGEEEWSKKVIATEGLVKSGSAKENVPKAKKIDSEGNLSLFLLPGAEFYLSPISNKAQAYHDPFKDGEVYLDKSQKDGEGAALVGWWNIVNRIFYGGTAYEALSLIGK
jgi:hypothetical protein